ncbi:MULTISPECIES: DUF6114 domain-containing protein [unclassified Nocardioides]|uniref:DUF6114 domain-containing protein n=1 Tax=unclassified Nocardioides TaxID=2615069 RepID=UPI000701ED66|nr:MULTISPECIES: DUF6114 domain-containing protein [unclassified Nocardioides]KQY57052.1 hypothetical protein ASD30_12380 [Nocardioides sp. Root140]KQZ68562.1 hypothetical protein ASD66_14790 [Nocardioides sp. Root151]KRF11692.1 hypothetical protein ASH02_17025 [Nocardioides sp. Soil796]
MSVANEIDPNHTDTDPNHREIDQNHAGTDPERSRLGSIVHSVNRFRRTRPFWGCIILALGGWFVLKPVIGSAAMTLELGVGGVSGYILGGGMIAAALIAFVLPAQRHFPALIATMLSVASLPLANLGGWLIGMFLGIVGAGMVFAWAPYSDKQLAKFAARAERRAERKALRKSGSSSASTSGSAASA